MVVTRAADYTAEIVYVQEDNFEEIEAQEMTRIESVLQCLLR